MLILSHRPEIAAIDDPALHALILDSTKALDEFDDYDFEELVKIIVVDPEDSLDAIDAELGFPLTDRPFELLQEHADWYEVVFVISDDGFGIEVFIPKRSGVDPWLLDWCRRNAQVPIDE